jgi:hypothetical protein
VAKRGNRQGKGVADKTIHPVTVRDPLLHSPDECADCDEPPNDPVILSATDQVITRMQLHKNRLVDFALIQQHRVDADSPWLDVAVADCHLDEVHVHWYDHNGQRSGRTGIMPITSQHDVESGFQIASDMLFDDWEENLRRCLDGR